MSIHRKTFGSSIFARVGDAEGVRELLDDPWFDSETIVIKPNWVSRERADFSDARTLRMVFEALDARFVVTESHMLQRHAGGKRFTVDGKEVDWNWLLVGDGWRWLIDNADWDWFIDGGHWEQIREDEQRFLDDLGFSDLFREFDVTYINVTDEVWSGRITDPEDVRQMVKGRFRPLRTEAFYGIVPYKLFDLRGSTFISLAKLKSYASFTFKNLFGMVPDPLRPYWHGRDNARLAAAIVDINKIYHALFDVYGICEALSETAVPHPDGAHQGIYTGKYNVVDAPGLVACGPDLVALDTLLLHLTEDAVVAYDAVNRAPLALAEREFGRVDVEAIREAKEGVGEWFSLGAPEAG